MQNAGGGLVSLNCHAKKPVYVTELVFLANLPFKFACLISEFHRISAGVIQLSLILDSVCAVNYGKTGKNCDR